MKSEYTEHLQVAEIREHWERVYSSRQEDEVSWFQPHAKLSLALLNSLSLPKSAQIMDIGGGASVFADDLIAQGFHNLTVLDLSEHALETARKRLGEKAKLVQWRAENILQAEFSTTFDVWHDRAVFHFLTQAEERDAYLHRVSASLNTGAYLVIATFAEDGPLKCSGLEVRRYSVTELQQLFEAKGFQLINSQKETHVTPWGAEQKFNYCLFVKR